MNAVRFKLVSVSCQYPIPSTTSLENCNHSHDTFLVLHVIGIEELVKDVVKDFHGLTEMKNLGNGCVNRNELSFGYSQSKPRVICKLDFCDIASPSSQCTLYLQDTSTQLLISRETSIQAYRRMQTPYEPVKCRVYIHVQHHDI
jgi:hypothetical protein